MMRMLLFCLIVVAMTGTFACQQTHYAREIHAIDSLLVLVDTVRIDYRRIDTTGYAEGSNGFASRIGFVQSAYKKDTMEREVAMLMANYRDLKKPFSRFKNEYERIGKEIEFSRNQLLDLKHDLEHNLLDSNLVRKMLSSETEAVDQLVFQVNELKLSQKTTRQKRQDLEPKVDSLIQYLKKDTLS
jgi:chromosome segregation ATPase